MGRRAKKFRIFLLLREIRLPNFRIHPKSTTRLDFWLMRLADRMQYARETQALNSIMG